MEIDLLERLPTPWGLLRGGVAPDHQEIKRLDDTFDRQTIGRGCRFFGNVEVGVDVSHSELMNHYTAVIYATGAQTDKSLGIPGEELPGSWAATEFVAWYNGHPDYRELEFDLTPRRAVVIGNGNVAADVVRMLTLSPEELERTDVADHALEALRESRIEEVVVLGRRGPAQAAFTSSELRELGHLDGVDLRVDPEDAELDPLSQDWLDEEGTFTARKNVELLKEFSASPGRPDAPRRIVLRFLRSPVEIRGPGRVEAVDVRRNQIVRDEAARSGRGPWTISWRRSTAAWSCARSATGQSRCPTCLSTSAASSSPTIAAGSSRQTARRSPASTRSAGSSAAPPASSGPTSATPRKPLRCLGEDLAAGKLPEPPEPGREQIDALLAERKPDLVTIEGWRAIDAHELERGRRQQRPRVKLSSREELLAAAKP